MGCLKKDKKDSAVVDIYEKEDIKQQHYPEERVFRSAFKLQERINNNENSRRKCE